MFFPIFTKKKEKKKSRENEVVHALSKEQKEAYLVGAKTESILLPR